MNKLSAIILVLAVIGGVAIFVLPGPSDPPKLHDVYWGPGEEAKRTDESIRPFKIVFSKAMIDDLRHRLKNTRKLQPPLEDVGWTYGVNSDFVPTFVEHWLNKYDFKKREAHLNQYPQFITNIQGLDIHFIHVKPELPKDRKIEVLPLYVQHGWPGSVIEFYKIIPMLTTPRADRDFVFEVVAPSLPGFGYSSAASKAGLGAIEIAHVMKNLMLRLGFDKFYTQGGDWGAIITANLAAMYPQHVLGMHSNMCTMLNPWSIAKMALYNFVPSLLAEEERPLMLPMSKLFSKILQETGYLHIQASKPDTLGVAVSDSPAGLAAYILEKFSSATKFENMFRDDGNVFEKFTADELIDNLMFYWAPNKATSAFRIYAESFNIHSMRYKMDAVPITVPSACAQFPNEVLYQPTEILRERFIDLVRVTHMPRGGHFAAMEEPKLLADDVWTTIRTMRELEAAKRKERLEKQKSFSDD